MTIRIRTFLAAVSLAALGACSDTKTSTSVTPPPAPAPSGTELFRNYVAIGTSISAGVQSDGLVAATQATAWPAQLDQMAGSTLPEPFIDGPGCRSPLVAPIASGVRMSGESAATDPADLSCAPLRADAANPTYNLALNGAVAKDALFTTSQTITDKGNAQIYARTLKPGQTQVTAMMALKPSIVSVELGANELLDSRTGVAIPGVSLFPYDAWAKLYDQVLDSVAKATKTAVIVGLIDNVKAFPALRSGDELWANRAEFAALNVTVSDDCRDSDNLQFVPVRVPTAVATAAAYATNNLGSYTLSCAAGEATTRDYVLTPSEFAIVNSQMRAMTDHIKTEAKRRGFAYFELGALYDRADLKTKYSVIAQMTSNTPYGTLISLDGLHPSALGQQVLARAAAKALNDTYRLGIKVPEAQATLIASR